MPIPRVDIMGMMAEAGAWRDPRQFLDMVTNPWIPGNWYNPATQSWNNPLQAFGLDRFFNRPGAPLPDFLRPGQPIDPYVYEGPGSPGWDPSIPGTERAPQNGQGPLMSHQRPPEPPRRAPGAGNGQTIASGRAAQDMVGGMRAGMNEANSRAQARNAMEQMFRGSER